MRPVRVTTSGVSVSPVIPIDQYLSPTNIGLGVDVTGAVTYTVEHTFDDVFAVDFVPATATWFPHPTLAGLLVDADGNYAFPPTGVRLNQTAGAGSAILNLIQAGAAA
ncbi:MAG TPA: hypothetical protein VMW50_02490 [Dehalococcoidia bacterium]|jgi:hypothetical protein|nr:hypothetical protein [Dehalococcoidia bacterium]